MRKLSRIFAVTLATALVPVLAGAADEVIELGAAAPAQLADASSQVALPWPVQVTGDGRSFLMYQPQVDRWQNNRIEGRSAVSVRDDAGGAQHFGVIYFSAAADLDARSGAVTIHDAAIGKVDFPALSAAGGDDLTLLRTRFAAHTWQVARERLQADMEIDRRSDQASKQAFNNDPPRILYSDRPAVLVPIDGDPVLRPVAATGLARVTNTRALILRDDATSRYDLFVSDHWMTSSSLAGPWAVDTNPSAQLEQAKQIATQQDQVDLLEASSGDGGAIPAAVNVYVSTTPAELVQTDGPPQYAPIERTQLLYVTNSPNQLFLDLRTQNHYALISGRWYRTPALAQAQWSYVPPASLPSDFAMIPADHPTQSVRAAVPGTPQAREAVIENSIPQVAAVTRDATRFDVVYDGSPVFQPIAGTSLQNAINAPVPVIRVSEQSFYALDNGVWFVASSPFGPWSVASDVPPAIYSIPPDSPLYYVTYVRIYDATPEVVYVGYTPGYLGSYVSSDNVVVYGTGWRYRPWIGSVWHGAPVTWGFGFSYAYTWWHPVPWYAWRRTSWVSPPCFQPWWGPWRAPAYARARAGYIGAGVNAMRPSWRDWHAGDRIYDRWDRRSVAWKSPAYPARTAITDFSRPRPGSGFVMRSDGQRRRIGSDGVRDWRDARARESVAASPGRPALQSLPAVQTPWRRPSQPDSQDNRRQVQSAQPLQSAQPRSQPPAFTGRTNPPLDNRPVRARERGFDRPQAQMAAPRVRAEGRPLIERSREVVNMPQARAVPQGANRAERAAAVNPGRAPERSAERAQIRRDAGHGESNSAGGRGRGRGGESQR
jgi:hypothetical protein